MLLKSVHDTSVRAYFARITGTCCWRVDISSPVNTARPFPPRQVNCSSTDPDSAVCFVAAVRGEEREQNGTACPGPPRNID